MNCLIRDIQERIARHRENLRLWNSGYLDPTEPEPEDRERTKTELKTAIQELEWVLQKVAGSCSSGEPAKYVVDRTERPTRVWFKSGNSVKVVLVRNGGKIRDAFLEVLGTVPKPSESISVNGGDVRPISEEWTL